MDKYKVVAAGTLKPGITEEQAVADLARSLRIEEAPARKLMMGQPVAVKKGLDRSTAEKLRDVLANAGLEVDLRPMNLPRTSASSPPPGQPVVNPVPPPAPVESSTTGEWADDGEYRYRLESRPDYAFLTVEIPAGSMLKVEAAAMATMDTNLSMKTKLGGGLKRFVSGESLFINEFTAEGGPGQIGIAPSIPGDMGHLRLAGEGVFLQNAAYVASTPEVVIDAKWQGLKKGFFSGEGLFLVRASGNGDVWFNTYGALVEIDVDGEYVVDNGHIVAFTEGLDYDIQKIGGYKSLLFSGEGLICRFSGRGKVWIQTRKARAFVWWAHFYRPVKKK